MTTGIIEQKPILEAYPKQEVAEVRGELRKSGIDIVGDVPWGTHLCQFYQSRDDLLDILVPYFKAGLENNEFCMWVTSEPLGVEDARAALGKELRDLDDYIARGQMEIVDYSEWYTKSGRFNADEVLQDWVEKENKALERGFDGLRLTGNTWWLEKKDWADFVAYEATVDRVIGKHKMLAICTYSLDKCRANEVIDVVSNHEFAIIRREGRWTFIESARRKQLIEELSESEEKWRSLVKDAPNMIMLTDRKCKIQFMNHTVSGFDTEDVIEKSIYDYIQPEHHDVVRETVNRVLKTGKHDSYQIKGAGPDGSISWYNTTISPIKRGGEVVSLIHIVLDITERKLAEKALKESEEKFRTFMETASDLMNMTDKDGKFTYANDSMVRTLGYSKEELIGMHITQVLSKEALEKDFKPNWGKFLANGEMSIETTLLTKEGKEIYCEIKVVAIYDSDGNYVGSRGVHHDLSERKQMEEALRESEELFRIASQITSDVVYERDLQTGIATFYGDIDSHLGYESGGYPRTLEGWREHVHPEDLAWIERKPIDQLEPGVPYSIEYRMRKKDGTYMTWLDQVMMIWDEKTGKPLKFIGAATDITERKKREQLQHDENYVLTLLGRGAELSELLDAIVRLGEYHDLFIKGSVLLLDPSSEYLAHASAPSLPDDFNEILKYGLPIGPNMGSCGTAAYLKERVIVTDIENSPLFKPFEEAVKRAISSGLLSVWSQPIISSNGDLLGTIANYGNKVGEPNADSLKVLEWSARIAAIAIELKRMESEKRELEQQAHLQSRLASVGEMASGIAHEINNPLTSVIGFAQLLMGRDIPYDMKHDLEVINGEAQRVAKIVEGLLTFARQRKSGREHVYVNDVISTVLELRSYQMKVNNIRVVPQLNPDLPLTEADPSQLQQVFLNIVLNAEKEMAKAHGKGKLVVKTERIDNTIRVSFTDDGPGISKENLGRIFDPFFTTREVGEGTGLGLSICHGIIVSHNGRIYAKSALDKGATFIIELPIVADTKQAEDTEVVEEETWHGRGSKILVVDDEPSILDFLNCLLTDQGYKVETVGRAENALKKLESGKYDLILLDIKLPGMNGIELYRRIEEVAPALANKVMFITGDVMETTTKEFLDRTGAAYIPKPIDIERLKKESNHILTKGLERQRT